MIHNCNTAVLKVSVTKLFVLFLLLVAPIRAYEGATDVSNITDSDDDDANYDEAVIYRECSQPGMIALTYDDGPNVFTEEFINNISVEYKVTFYVNGWNYENVQESPWHSILKLAYEKGHEIGNHGWNHWSYINASGINDDKVRKNLNNTQVLQQMTMVNDIIYAIIGKAPNTFRPPYGQFNQGTLRIAPLAGLDYMALWNIDSQDWEFENSPDTFDAIMNIIMDPTVDPTESSFVIVMHEQVETSMLLTTPLLYTILDDLGYRLVTMSECIGLDSGYQEDYVPLINFTLYNGGCNNYPNSGLIISFITLILLILNCY